MLLQCNDCPYIVSCLGAFITSVRSRVARGSCSGNVSFNYGNCGLLAICVGCARLRLPALSLQSHVLGELPPPIQSEPAESARSRARSRQRSAAGSVALVLLSVRAERSVDLHGADEHVPGEAAALHARAGARAHPRQNRYLRTLHSLYSTLLCASPTLFSIAACAVRTTDARTRTGT